MAEHSRRDFLRGVGVTAAAATVAVIAPGGLASASTPKSDDDTGPTPAGSVVAYVKDPASGSVIVMKGGSEVVVNDKALARKLAKLAR